MSRYLVVGQGVAGICLAHSLRRRGLEVHCIDAPNPRRASSVAAGIINPVTGQRIVFSWRFQEFFPVAQAFYRDLEQVLQTTLWYDRTIVRALRNTDEVNQWSSRSGDAELAQYMHLLPDAGAWSEVVEPHIAFGKLHPAAQVNLPLLCSVWREKGLNEGWFTQREITGNALAEISKSYSAVILCLGYGACQLGICRRLPWVPAKGTILHVNIPNTLKPDTLLKKKILIAPPIEGHSTMYWVGANYEWDFLDDWPTANGIDEVLSELKALIRAPFELHGISSGVRPVLKDRRPILGRLNDNIYIFNGLGAKGALLAPYWAEHLAEHLILGVEIDDEVGLKRFVGGFYE